MRADTRNDWCQKLFVEGFGRHARCLPTASCIPKSCSAATGLMDWSPAASALRFTQATMFRLPSQPFRRPSPPARRTTLLAAVRIELLKDWIHHAPNAIGSPDERQRTPLLFRVSCRLLGATRATLALTPRLEES